MPHLRAGAIALSLLTIIVPALAVPVSAHTGFVCGGTYDIFIGDGGAGLAMSATYIHFMNAPAALTGFDLVATDAMGDGETVHVPGPAGHMVSTDWHQGATEFRVYAGVGHVGVEVTVANCAF